jgi:transposase
MAVLPPGLAQALGPVLEQIATMTVKIKHYDRLIKRLTETEYTETQALIKVYGVGQLTALTYVLTLGSKERFQRIRDVGCYLGLRPRRSQSGDPDPQLGITKAGNVYLRSLLVECANHVLGPRGKDSTLRQWRYILHRAEASSHGIEPSSPSLASSLSCSIASGSPRSLTSRSMQ